MAKRRIRTLLRSGWTEVKVPRKNLYKYDPYDPTSVFGDDLYMKEIVSWCQTRYKDDEYSFSPAPYSPYSEKYKDCFKRFVFKNEKDATLFLLRWGV